MLEEYYKSKNIPNIGMPILNKHISMHNMLTQCKPLKDWTSYISIGSGIINKNYKITLNKKDNVALKILSKNNVVINREDEIYNLKIANDLKITPNLIHYDLNKSIIITEFIDSSTLTIQDLLSKKTTSEIINIMKKLHSGKRFKNNFDIFKEFEKYLNICKTNNYKLPKRFLKYEKYFYKLKDFIEFYKLDLVPCHNDLWVNNILNSSDGLKIIDFELSGNNDPRFELGNFWQESGFNDEYLSQITTEYFGYKSEINELIAKLYGIASAYTWCLVGVILSYESKIHYDYDSFIKEKFLFVNNNLNSKLIKKLNNIF